MEHTHVEAETFKTLRDQETSSMPRRIAVSKYLVNPVIFLCLCAKATVQSPCDFFTRARTRSLSLKEELRHSLTLDNPRYLRFRKLPTVETIELVEYCEMSLRLVFA